MSEETAFSNSWKFHSARESLIAEAHARPSQNITGPAQILHLAFRADETVYQLFFDRLNSTNNASVVRHANGTIDGIRLKFERHSEFMSCTLFEDNVVPQKYSDLVETLNKSFPMADVEILVLLKLELLKNPGDLLKALPFEQRIYGGKLRNAIDVRSTFSPDDNGFICFVLQGKGPTSDELGRRMQRLIEMETYRTIRAVQR